MGGSLKGSRRPAGIAGRFGKNGVDSNGGCGRKGGSLSTNREFGADSKAASNQVLTAGKKAVE